MLSMVKRIGILSQTQEMQKAWHTLKIASHQSMAKLTDLLEMTFQITAEKRRLT